MLEITNFLDGAQIGYDSELLVQKFKECDLVQQYICILYSIHHLYRHCFRGYYWGLTGFVIHCLSACVGAEWRQSATIVRIHRML